MQRSNAANVRLPLVSSSLLILHSDVSANEIRADANRPKNPSRSTLRSEIRWKQSAVGVSVRRYTYNHRSHLKEAAPALWEAKLGSSMKAGSEKRVRAHTYSTVALHMPQRYVDMQLSHASRSCRCSLRLYASERASPPPVAGEITRLYTRPDYSHLLIIALLKLASI